jgi:hypothetical protein
LAGFTGGRGGRFFSRAISSFSARFSARSAWFSISRLSTLKTAHVADQRTNQPTELRQRQTFKRISW